MMMIIKIFFFILLKPIIGFLELNTKVTLLYDYDEDVHYDTIESKAKVILHYGKKNINVTIQVPKEWVNLIDLIMYRNHIISVHHTEKSHHCVGKITKLLVCLPKETLS